MNVKASIDPKLKTLSRIGVLIQYILAGINKFMVQRLLSFFNLEIAVEVFKLEERFNKFFPETGLKFRHTHVEQALILASTAVDGVLRFDEVNNI